jgi:hypothetical protein
VAERRFETVFNIDFNNTSIMDKATAYMYRAIKEAIEITLHSNNFNRHLGFTVS